MRLLITQKDQNRPSFPPRSPPVLSTVWSKAPRLMGVQLNQQICHSNTSLAQFCQSCFLIFFYIKYDTPLCATSGNKKPILQFAHPKGKRDLQVEQSEAKTKREVKVTEAFSTPGVKGMLLQLAPGLQR